MSREGDPGSPAPSFPPGPRSWPGLVDQVIAHVAGTGGDVDWAPMARRGLDRPWVGVAAPAVCDQRAWVWDVVTPEDRDGVSDLADDPLVLAVSQDVVVVEMGRGVHPAGRIRLQIPVRTVPLTVELPAGSVPDAPWSVSLSTGWTTEAIARGLECWSEAYVGGLTRRPGADEVPPDEPDRFEVGEGLFITGDAFDRLLRLDPLDAATITRTFSAICEALVPYR